MNEAIRQVLSDTIPTLKDPRIGFVTITGVEAATGYAHATVYVSVFGTRGAAGAHSRGPEGRARRPSGAGRARAATAANPGSVVPIRSDRRAGRPAREDDRRARARAPR